MKTSTLVLAATLGATLIAHPPAASAQTPQPTVVLTWVDRAGKAIATVGPAAAYRGPDLSPDGKQLAVHRHDDGTPPPGTPGSGDVLVFESGPGPGRRLTPASSGAVDNAMPIWSPDGTRIAFGSMRNGKGGIYVRRADGTGGEELLFESETTKMPMSWSPDGKYIVYWSPGNIQWVLPLSGDRKPFQLTTTYTSHAQISPDGKWVTYMRTGAGSQIVVQSFPKGSTVVQVSKGDGGVFPRWRGDSKELFWLSQGQNGQLMAADITVNGSRILAGAPRALFDSGYVNMNHPGGNYHVFAAARDGQRFLIPRPDSSDNPNARTLTLIDRQGKTIGTVAERGLYNGVAFSPDRTRVALLKNDPAKGTNDVWVFDIATGKGAPVTSVAPKTAVGLPLWSPDGQRIAYIMQRDGVSAIYQKRSNGEGPEELVFTFDGANLNLQEWTADGRYLTYYSPQLGGNIMFALPLSGERKPIVIARSQFTLIHARLSPDHRFLAYRSDESGKDQVWVRRTELSGPTTDKDKWQVSIDGGTGPVYWREDGKEVVYLSLDRGMMSVAVRTESGFTFDPPKLLFKVPEAFPAGGGIGPQTSMTRDGERFLFAVPRTPPPPAPDPVIAILDRAGRSIQTLGDPGRYLDVTLSPDGTRVLVLKGVGPNNNNIERELWSLDVATGKGPLVAKGQIFSQRWSPDGRRVYYVVNRPGGFRPILSKAADGSGAEETIYTHSPGAPVNINDITPDSRFLIFESGGVLLMLPLTTGDAASRQAVEFLREEYAAWSARFSPDGRAIAFISDETDRGELYVQGFDPVSGKPVGRTKRKMTSEGADDVLMWRADGKELYYTKGDMNAGLLMAVDVSTPAPRSSAPRFLFRSAGQPSGDGQRFLIVMPRQ